MLAPMAHFHATVEQETWEASESKFQAIMEASEAGKEAEAGRNEASISIARTEAAVLKRVAIKQAFAKKMASLQKRTDALLAKMESRLKAEKRFYESVWIQKTLCIEEND